MRTVIWSVLLMMALPVAAERPIAAEMPVASAPLRSVVDELGRWHVEIELPTGGGFFTVDAASLEPLAQLGAVAEPNPASEAAWLRNPRSSNPYPLKPLPGGGHYGRADGWDNHKAFDEQGRLIWHGRMHSVDVRGDRSFVFVRTAGRVVGRYAYCDASQDVATARCVDLDFGSEFDMRVFAAPSAADGGLLISRERYPPGWPAIPRYVQPTPVRVARFGANGERIWTRDISIAPGWGGSIAGGWLHERIVVLYVSDGRYRIWVANARDGSVLSDRPFEPPVTALGGRSILIDPFGVTVLWSTGTAPSERRRTWVLQQRDVQGRIEYEVPVAGFTEPKVLRTHEGGTLVHEAMGRVFERRDAIGRLLWRIRLPLEEKVSSVAVDRERVLVALSSGREPGVTVLRQYTLAGGHAQRERRLRDWMVLPSYLHAVTAGDELWLLLRYSLRQRDALLTIDPSGTRVLRWLDPGGFHWLQRIPGVRVPMALVHSSAWTPGGTRYELQVLGPGAQPTGIATSRAGVFVGGDRAVVLDDGRIQLLRDLPGGGLERQRWMPDGRLDDVVLLSPRVPGSYWTARQFTDGTGLIASDAGPIHTFNNEGTLQLTGQLSPHDNWHATFGGFALLDPLPGLPLRSVHGIPGIPLGPVPPFLVGLPRETWVDRRGQVRWTRHYGLEEALGDILELAGGHHVLSDGLRPIDLDSGQLGPPLHLPIVPGRVMARGSLAQRDLLVVTEELDRPIRLFRIDIAALEATELPLALPNHVSKVEIIPARDLSWLLACHRSHAAEACSVRHYPAH